MLRLASWVCVLGLTGIVSSAPVAAEDYAESSGSPWLGVYLVDEVDGGIRIVAIVPGGPAAIAGLRSGDLLLEAGSVELADQGALERVLGGRVADEPLEFEVLRDGESLAVQVVPARNRVAFPRVLMPEPATPAAPPERALAPWPRLSGHLGLEVVPITPELRRHYGAGGDRGVLVVRAEPDALGGSAGVAVGDVVVAVGGAPVKRPAELELGVARWTRREPLALGIVREGRPIDLEVPAPAPLPRAVAPPFVSPDPEARRRLLEASIERLERRIEALQRQLKELNEQEPSPDR